jgi:hypothetical protein
MNNNSVAVAFDKVKGKTQTVALCVPAFEAVLDSVTTTGITAGFQPSFTQRELPTQAGKEVGQGGFVWLSNNVLSVVERLPKKCRPSVRSVLLAYAQLSSRRGNARTFPAAAELVARMAGCSVSTVHLADKHLRDAGLIVIQHQKVGGRDVPRLVTLSEVAAAPPIAFEVVAAEDLPSVRRYRRQQSKKSSDTGVRVAVCKSDTLKKHSEEKHILQHTSLSLSPRRAGGHGGQRRESLEEVKERLAREHGMEAEEVGRLWEKHVANMEAGRAAGRVQGYATPANFSNNFDSIKARHKPKATKLSCPGEEREKEKAAIARAMAERETWWQRFAATTAGTPSRYDQADDETRFRFMTSNEGASFAALASSHSINGLRFKFDEATGSIHGHGYLTDGGDW